MDWCLPSPVILGNDMKLTKLFAISLAAVALTACGGGGSGGGSNGGGGGGSSTTTQNSTAATSAATIGVIGK